MYTRDTIVKTNQLRLGDTVEQLPLGDRPWGACIVKHITDEEVELFRPYGTTADFSYTGGVICYVGIETYKVHKLSNTEWKLHRRQELR